MRHTKLNEYSSDILFAAALTFIVLFGIKQDIPFIATAFAASVYLSFINPYSKYSTPWNISASYVTAAIYGMILNRALEHELASNSVYYTASIFFVFALFAETITLIKAEHPPAAAVLVSFAYTDTSANTILLFSCMILIMVIIDFLFEKLLEHKKQIIHTTKDEIRSLRKSILKNITQHTHNYKH